MLVFIHINKTAGSTVRYILRSTYGVNHCEVEPWHAQWSDPPFSSEDLHRLRKLYPNLQSIAGHRVTGYMDLKEKGTDFQYFSFMREPLKTCASRFQYNIQYRKKKDLVFEDWIQKDWTRNRQTTIFAGIADVEKAIQIIKSKKIFIGLTERFDESMVLLKEFKAKELNIAYQPVNVAKKNSIAADLLANEKTRQLLVEANQADLQLYNYVKTELYPTFQREYGPSLETDVANYHINRNQNFNSLNIALSRFKQYLIYKPALYLNRKGLAFA